MFKVKSIELLKAQALLSSTPVPPPIFELLIDGISNFGWESVYPAIKAFCARSRLFPIVSDIEAALPASLSPTDLKIPDELILFDIVFDKETVGCFLLRERASYLVQLDDPFCFNPKLQIEALKKNILNLKNSGWLIVGCSHYAGKQQGDGKNVVRLHSILQVSKRVEK